MKRTLLELTQSILNDMDSEPVNSIFDTEEAVQCSSVIRDTYFNIVAARQTPEHDELIKLTALSDSARPTLFQYPTNVKEIRLFEYDKKEVYWKDPIKFLDSLPNAEDDNVIEYVDPVSGITLTARNDKGPRYYTSFDNQYVVCDSYDSAVDTTLQESKTRCWGTKYPTFTMSDSFVPDLNETLFPYLLAESKSVCFSVFKSGSDPKVEQAARRLKNGIQNDRFKTKRDNTRNYYGRA
jgi:hypothetical protein